MSRGGRKREIDVEKDSLQVRARHTYADTGGKRHEVSKPQASLVSKSQSSLEDNELSDIAQLLEVTEVVLTTSKLVTQQSVCTDEPVSKA